MEGIAQNLGHLCFRIADFRPARQVRRDRRGDVDLRARGRWAGVPGTSPRFVLPGRGISAAVVLFLLVASVLPKLAGAAVATDTPRALGRDPRHALAIGLIELACAILCTVPRTAVLVAVATTGLLGRAIATRLRVDAPLFTHTLFGVYLGMLLWAELWLPTPALRAVFPLRTARSGASIPCERNDHG